ncbi:MAG: 4'-phosphopantetheinyl transferase superfamily protein [Bacteroidota bacterium]|nr:4'-phosphopantetheinyl transferase superfamily protein [Bacteroidota bacterium]
MNWQKSGNIKEITGSKDLLIVYGTNSLAENLDLHEILTSEELIYAERLRGPGQKSTWLSCRAGLRLVLGSYLSINPQIIEFEKNRFGKLHMVDSKLFFNVSHSNNSFLLGFNHSGRIGVDIEKLSGREDIPSLIKYAFSDAESNYCKSGNLAERFTEIWTLKEAFLKAAGVGLVEDLTSVTVTGSAENNLSQLNLNQESFLCPNGETGSIVFKNKLPLKFSWITI